MVRLTRIYTRTGDGGSTRLVGSQQVPKDSARVEAYGAVDELNAVLGLLSSRLRAAVALEPDARDVVSTWLTETQQRLFDLGSDLATRLPDRWEGQPLITADHVRALEGFIDGLNAELPALESFVLPGGGELAALAHLARTVCRRAERRTTTLDREEAISEQAVPYLNRLSDALFVLARWVARRSGETEVLWSK